MRAWDIHKYQVIGPDWISPLPRDGDAGRYDVTANVPPGATAEQVRMMWRSLLADRFGVVLHHASKEFAAKDLVVVKGGTKMVRSAQDPGIPALEISELTKDEVVVDKDGCVQLSAPAIVTYVTSSPGGATLCMAMRGQTTAQLASNLSERDRRPVIDKTGLTGTYDFCGTVQPKAAIRGCHGTAAGSQVGGQKATVDVIVIDKANKMPSEN